MSTHATDAGRDTVEVHNRLDKVVLALAVRDDDAVSTTLTPADARAIAVALNEAAATAEQTPPS